MPGTEFITVYCWRCDGSFGIEENARYLMHDRYEISCPLGHPLQITADLEHTLLLGPPGSFIHLICANGHRTGITRAFLTEQRIFSCWAGPACGKMLFSPASDSKPLEQPAPR